MTENQNTEIPAFEIVDEIPSKGVGRPLSPEVVALCEVAAKAKGKWVRVPCADPEETRRWQARVKGAMKRKELTATATRNGDVYVRAAAEQ